MMYKASCGLAACGGGRPSSLGPNSLSTNHEQTRSLPTSFLASGDDYESTGQAPIVALAEVELRTHLDIGSNRGLENKKVAALNTRPNQMQREGPPPRE